MSTRGLEKSQAGGWTAIGSRQNLRLLLDLTKRDFRLRYLGSVLGSYWNLIHPLVMILIYTMIFSQVMKAKLGGDGQPFAYSIYLCSGILAWNFFSEVVNRSATTLLENAGFLKKISIKPYVLFGATFLSALLNFTIAFGLFSLFLVFAKPVSLVSYLYYWGVVGALGGFALGFGTLLGCLNVFIRDVQQLLSVTFQLWFWFTPIVYLYDALPEIARRVLVLNPAFPYISSLHKLIYYGTYPDGQDIALMAFWTFGALLLGRFVYSKSISFIRDQL